MHLLVRRVFRLIAAVMVVTIAGVASVTCFDMAGITAQDRPCCEAMGHECGGTMATGHGCCSTEAGDQAFQQIDGSRPVKIQKPVSTLLATLDFVEVNRLVDAITVTALQPPRGSPPRLRSVPTYLAISTFRL